MRVIGDNKKDDKPEPRNPYANRRSLGSILKQVKSSRYERGSSKDVGINTELGVPEN
jgi:hypothetical protein